MKMKNSSRSARDGYEQRTCVLSEVRVVDPGGDTPPTIAGYAAVFDSPAEVGSMSEVVKTGAFTRTLAEGADVRAMVEHNPAMILGRQKPGTLSLSVDGKGLFATINPPDTQVGRDAVESIRRGDLDGMSFGFRAITDNWRMMDGKPLRELVDVDLFDVSVVAFPVYPDTSVSVRSHDAWQVESRGQLTVCRARLRLAEVSA